jgi:hypothetical protein
MRGLLEDVLLFDEDVVQGARVGDVDLFVLCTNITE